MKKIKISAKEINQTVREFKIHPSQGILHSLKKDIDDINDAQILLSSINVDGISPKHRVHEEYTSFLREDKLDESENLNIKDILRNAFDKEGNYILIPKVIK